MLTFIVLTQTIGYRVPESIATACRSHPHPSSLWAEFCTRFLLVFPVAVLGPGEGALGSEFGCTAAQDKQPVALPCIPSPVLSPKARADAPPTLSPWISVSLQGAQHHLKSCTDSVGYFFLFFFSSFFSPVCGTNSALLEAPLLWGWSVQVLPGYSMPEFGHSLNLSTHAHTRLSACFKAVVHNRASGILGRVLGRHEGVEVCVHSAIA